MREVEVKVPREPCTIAEDAPPEGANRAAWLADCCDGDGHEGAKDAGRDLLN